MAKRAHFATINGKSVESFKEGLALLREEWSEWKADDVAEQIKKAEAKGKSYTPPEATMPSLEGGKS